MSKAIQQSRNFFSNKKGTVAPLFGLMTLPMLAITGGAIDFGKAVSIKSKLQASCDQASVAAALEYGATGDPAKAEERLRARIGADIAKFGLTLNDPPTDPTMAPEAPEGSEIIIKNAGVDTSQNKITPQIETNVPTVMLNLIGMNEMNVQVDCSAQLAGKELELSLMLDVTGSMGWWSGGQKKIDAMKWAANDLLDIFRVNMEAEKTRIALVPFSEAVNVGNLAQQVRGSYQSGTSWTPGHFKFRFRKGNNTRTYKITDCVSERLGPERYTDEPPSVAKVGRVYRSGTNCKPSKEIMPLTADRDALRNRINSLSATGGTAGHIGTAWAWYTLSPKWDEVFTGTSAPAEHDPDKRIKAAILMTDGEYNVEYKSGVNDNNINGSADNGSSSHQARQLCQAMKDNGIVVYTVGFGISQGSNQEQLMKDCASGDDKYFFPYDPQELRAAFREIGGQLAAGQAGVQMVN